MGDRKNIPCERFVNEYDTKGNGEHFICSEDKLCKECISKKRDVLVLINEKEVIL